MIDISHLTGQRLMIAITSEYGEAGTILEAINKSKEGPVQDVYWLYKNSGRFNGPLSQIINRINYKLDSFYVELRARERDFVYNFQLQFWSKIIEHACNSRIKKLLVIPDFFCSSCEISI